VSVVKKIVTMLSVACGSLDIMEGDKEATVRKIRERVEGFGLSRV